MRPKPPPISGTVRSRHEPASAPLRSPRSAIKASVRTTAHCSRPRATPSSGPPLTRCRSGLSPRFRSASSPLFLGWSGPSQSTRRSFRYRLRTHRARQPHLHLRRCCADLRRAPPDRLQSAHLDTRSPQVTAVSGRAAAIIARAGRVTTIGRIMATAIPSAGSPASDLAPIASIVSPGYTVAAGSTVAASTLEQLFTVQPDSAVSARGSDIWAASVGDK